jgi:hypothetical protein
MLLSLIRILTLFKQDPGSCIKREIKNTNYQYQVPFFLLLVPGASLRSQKDNESRILIWKELSRIQGVKDTGYQIRNTAGMFPY